MPTHSIFLAFLLVRLVLPVMPAAAGSGNDLLPDIPNGSIVVRLVEVADVSPDPVIDITHAGDGSDRLFLVSPRGIVRILHGGAVLPVPFLDAPASPPDRAMSGLAFHPNFATNGKFYVISGEATPNPSTPHYIAPQNDTGSAFDNVLCEYQVSESDSNVAEPASRRELLRVHQAHRLHNINDLCFGGDGFLYIAAGDGGETRTGSPVHYNTTAQQTDNPFGSILRIDVDVIGPNGRYDIPPGNPFPTGSCPEIYAWGLRNPWRISTDRLTGLVFTAINGDMTIEQVVHVEANHNYGWDNKEGSFLWNPASGEATVDPAPDPQFTSPLAEYDHATTTGPCLGSAIGGFVYRGPTIAALTGRYLFLDFVGAQLISMDPDNGALEIVGVDAGGAQLTPNSFITWGEDEQGELYVGTLAGRVYQLVSPTSTPVLVQRPRVLLEPAHPNPFNPAARVAFEIDAPQHVELALYDVRGRKLLILQAGFHDAGRHVVRWGRRPDAARLASGTYRLVLSGSGWRQSRNVTLLQ